MLASGVVLPLVEEHFLDALGSGAVDTSRKSCVAGVDSALKVHKSFTSVADSAPVVHIQAGETGETDRMAAWSEIVEAGGAGETGRVHGYFRVSEQELDLVTLPVPQILDGTVEATSVDSRTGLARRACVCQIFQSDSRDCCRGSDVVPF